MKVKITVSAAGADFVLIYGQEHEFDEVKRLVGNGAENFCVPVDPSEPWPPVAGVVESPAAEPVADEVEAVSEQEAETEPEVAVANPLVERAVKPRGRSRRGNGPASQE